MTNLSKLIRFNRQNWRHLLLCLGSGVLMPIAFPGVDIWPLAFVTFVPWLHVLEAHKEHTRSVLWFSFVAGFVGTYGGFYWLNYVLTQFGGFPIWICFAIATILVAYQALQFVLLGWIWMTLRRQQLSLTAAAVIAICVAEFVFPLLFPFFYGVTLHSQPYLIQVLDLGGPLLLSAFVMLINGFIYEGFVALKNRQSPPKKLIAVTLTVSALYIGYSSYRIHEVQQQMAHAETAQIGMVQANMGLFEKRSDPMEGWRRHLELSQQLQDQGADLIIWSESGYGYAIAEQTTNVKRAVMGPLNTPLLFGAVALRDGEKRKRVYNTAFITDSQGNILGTYDKTYRLAFGEYLPLGDTFPVLYEMSPNTSRFEKGSHVKSLPFGKHMIATLICYEDVLPDFVRSMVQQDEPELLVNITNDAWFGDSTEPWEHLALAKLRAVEHHRYLARVTNSGVTALVDPLGRVVSHTETFEKTKLAGEIAWLKRHTVFEYVGQWPGWLSIVLLIFFAWVRPRMRPRNAS